MYTRLGDDVLEAEMRLIPVLISRLACCMAARRRRGGNAGIDGRIYDDPRRTVCGGTELNATHHRPVSEGKVRGAASRCILDDKIRAGKSSFSMTGAALLHLSAGHSGFGMNPTNKMRLQENSVNGVIELTLLIKYWFQLRFTWLLCC